MALTTSDDQRPSKPPAVRALETLARTPSSKYWRPLQFVLAALVVGILLKLSVNASFYATTIISPYSSLAIFSALIVLWMIRRTWSDLLWVSLGTAFLFLLDYRVVHFKPAYMAGFSFVGLAAFAVFAIRTLWAEGKERTQLLYGLFAATLFVSSEFMASTFLAVTEQLHPKTLDLFLYSFDASMRVQISFLVGQIFWKHLWVRAICIMFYLALPLPLALVYAAQLQRLGYKALVVMTAFLVTGPIGVLCYNMLPACGPVHLFGLAFPFHPVSTADAAKLALTTLPVAGARNAIPSLHMTWVLLIWWNSKGLPRWIRAIALSFVWATALATTGTGEHYFVDLVVAFPFSLCIQALSSFWLPFRSGPRRTAFLFGTFTTLVWLMMLSFETRLFWLSPILPWIAIVGTISVSVLLWHRLLNVLFPEKQNKSTEAQRPAALARALGAS